MNSIGDFLVQFKQGTPLPPTRTGSHWNTLSQAPSPLVFTTPPDTKWNGFPFTPFTYNGITMWLLGELYGSSSIAQVLEQLAKDYSYAHRLNGHFLIFAWEQKAKMFHIWTSRFGTLHAYYNTHSSCPSVATSLISLSRNSISDTLHWPAISMYFKSSFFPDDLTCFKDVHICKPASHYCFDNQGTCLSKHRYWDWTHAPRQDLSLSNQLSRFHERLLEVSGEISNTGRVALPVSGGLDSRTLASSLSHNSAKRHGNVFGFSYGYQNSSVETSIATNIAQSRQLPFTKFTIEPYIFESLPLIQGSTEGIQDITQCRQAFVFNWLQEHADSVVAGHWGDVWLDDMGLLSHGHEPFTNGDLVKKALHKFEKEGNTWLLNNICHKHTEGVDVDDCQFELLKKACTPYQHLSEADFKLKAFKTDQWSFRSTTASLRMYQAAAFPKLPFYDTRLSDFFATLPSSLVAKRYFQIEYLKKYARDLAKITWQDFDTNLFWYTYFDSLLIPKRAVKKLLRSVSRRKTYLRNWEVHFLNPQGKIKLYECLLEKYTSVHQFVSPRKIETLLSEFYQDPYYHKRGYTVSMLLSFSSWIHYLQQTHKK
ncbi:MAG: hypothetical protein HQK83_06555 [Fibrobacteria bacterium]|nr:hypothetical protein [Fibrobacteria bacterium]